MQMVSQKYTPTIYISMYSVCILAVLGELLNIHGLFEQRQPTIQGYQQD